MDWRAPHQLVRINMARVYVIKVLMTRLMTQDASATQAHKPQHSTKCGSLPENATCQGPETLHGKPSAVSDPLRSCWSLVLMVVYFGFTSKHRVQQEGIRRSRRILLWTWSSACRHDRYSSR